MRRALQTQTCRHQCVGMLQQLCGRTALSSLVSDYSAYLEKMTSAARACLHTNRAQDRTGHCGKAIAAQVQLAQGDQATDGVRQL